MRKWCPEIWNTELGGDLPSNEQTNTNFKIQIEQMEELGSLDITGSSN